MGWSYINAGLLLLGSACVELALEHLPLPPSPTWFWRNTAGGMSWGRRRINVSFFQTKMSPVNRTYSCFSGLGILAGATMLPVTNPQGKSNSEDSINNNGEESQKKKTNRVWRFLLGQNLASSTGLNNYFLFLLSDFLCFMSIYIAYVHLPIFVQVKHICLIRPELIKTQI